MTSECLLRTPVSIQPFLADPSLRVVVCVRPTLVPCIEQKFQRVFSLPCSTSIPSLHQPYRPQPVISPSGQINAPSVRIPVTRPASRGIPVMSKHSLCVARSRDMSPDRQPGRKDGDRHRHYRRMRRNARIILEDAWKVVRFLPSLPRRGELGGPQQSVTRRSRSHMHSRQSLPDQKSRSGEGKKNAC